MGVAQAEKTKIMSISRSNFLGATQAVLKEVPEFSFFHKQGGEGKRGTGKGWVHFSEEGNESISQEK